MRAVTPQLKRSRDRRVEKSWTDRAPSALHSGQVVICRAKDNLFYDIVMPQHKASSAGPSSLEVLAEGNEAKVEKDGGPPQARLHDSQNRLGFELKSKCNPSKTKGMPPKDLTPLSFTGRVVDQYRKLVLRFHFRGKRVRCWRNPMRIIEIDIYHSIDRRYRSYIGEIGQR